MPRLLVTVFVCLALSAGLAAGTPEDLFFESAGLVREAELAASKAEHAKARAKYTAALEILQRLRVAHPDWNTQVVEFRIRTYSAILDELPPTAPPPPSPDYERIRQLTRELEQSQQLIAELETVRDQLTTKFTVESEAARANRHEVENRLATLTNQLTAAQQELRELRRKVTTKTLTVRDAIMEAATARE